jgi:predicted SAM-dependent methyltransferase
MLKVQLGAFDRPANGWLNTDITPHIWIAKIPFAPRILYSAGFMTEQRYHQHVNSIFSSLSYLDLSKPLPFTGNSVDAIFSSHVFEHLFMDEVERLIQEIHRCLTPGGICRVVVPDLEKIIKIFDRQDPRQFVTAIFEVSARRNVKNAHHCGFTGSLLEKLFREAGFTETAVLAYKVGRCPDVEELDNRPEESLFFEAIK